VKRRKQLSPERKIDKTRLKKSYSHEGATPGYKPKFPKPGKSLKIDDPNSPTWRRKAGGSWGQYIHATQTECMVNDETCQGELEAHHFVGKRNVLVCFDPDNGGILCRCHHKESKECSPHMGPLGFAELLQESYPDVAYYIIQNQHRTGKPDFRADYHRLKKLLQELNMTSRY